MSTALTHYLYTHLREAQLKQLAILQEIHRICTAHAIDYWLDGGTLLGAVRHGGFIPWDDDIDIAMREEDLPRFAEACRTELPDHLYLQTTDTEPACRLPICKVRDKESFLVEYADDFTRPYGKGLYVDIFPMIPYPSVSRRFIRRVAGGYCKANAILQSQHYYSWRSCAELLWFGAKRAALKLLWHAAVALRGKGEYTSNVLHNNGYGIMHRTDSLFPTAPIAFEGHTFQGPANPDAYLQDLYRDYMKLPPEEKRRGHAVFFIPDLKK